MEPRRVARLPPSLLVSMSPAFRGDETSWRGRWPRLQGREVTARNKRVRNATRIFGADQGIASNMDVSLTGSWGCCSGGTRCTVQSLHRRSRRSRPLRCQCPGGGRRPAASPPIACAGRGWEEAARHRVQRSRERGERFAVGRTRNATYWVSGLVSTATARRDSKKREEKQVYRRVVFVA